MESGIEKYKVFSIQSHSSDESRMVDFVIEEVERIADCRYYKDDFGNLFVTKGKTNIYPCYIAHLDTVHPIKDDADYNLVIEEGVIFARSQNHERCGVGGDDKCGVYICLEMLRELDNCKVALFSREENGGIGAYQCDLTFFDDCSFIAGLDTPSNDEIEMETCDLKLASDEFISVIIPIAMRYGYHSVTSYAPHDGLTLVERGIKTSGFCSSVGYYNQHKENDYVVIADMEKAVEFCKHIATALATKLYRL